MKTIQQRIEAALNTNDAATIRRTLRRLGFWNACGRCDGKGHINGFDHVANGVCFACMGRKGRPAKMTKALVAELESTVARGALSAGHAAKVANIGARFATDMTTYWRNARVGANVLFA